jgi:predicted permease
MQPGVSLEQARSEMKAIAGRLAADFPSLYSRLEIWVSTLGERFEDSGSVFMFLLGTSGTILLIACANLAGLFLVRSVHRRVEICVRSALGADRLRLIRQLLVESVALALIGGGLGLLGAKWSFDLLVAFFPAELAASLPSFFDFHLDWLVLGFAVAISLISGVLFGLVPAIESSQVNLSSGLQGGGRDVTGGHQARRLSQTFVATQVAVCFATVMFTAICFNSLSRFVRTPPGFDSRDLLTFGITLAGPDFSQADRRISFLEQVVERVHALPGVQSACSADTLPFCNPRLSRISVVGRAYKELGNGLIYTADVSPDYFRTLEIPISKGRSFTRQDHSGATRTAIVSDSLAAKLFGAARDPIGQRISLEATPGEFEIVGVVANVQQMTLGTIRTESMNLYLCQLQTGGSNAMVALRTSQDSRALMGPLRKIVSELNPDLPLFAVKRMDELIALDQQLFRYLTWCMAVFSILALSLAVLGIYGTVAYSVAQRTREIGVRLALGSSTSRILALVMSQGMKPIFVGLALGIIASLLFVHPVVQALFQNVADAEQWMWFGVGLLLTASMGAACLRPAFRASRVNPMEALRYE